ncbi:hypothetical protein [Chitinimonas sp.]|uniref:hypothetical protein n=1 Tax=Chitinimonas sp. TaxID=1934313 RepID=UPI0035B33EBC
MASVTFSPVVGGDGSTVTDGSDASTGLDAGGWRVRFVPALAQVVAVAQWLVGWVNAQVAAIALNVSAASGSATSASNSATAAGNSASSAYVSAGQAQTSATAAAASAAQASAVTGLPLPATPGAVLQVNAGATGYQLAKLASTDLADAAALATAMRRAKLALYLQL